MLTCAHATRLISDGLDVELTLRQRVSLRVHLWICSGCANFRKQARWLQQLAGHYADGQAASAALSADDTSRTDTAEPTGDDKPSDSR